MKFYLTIPRFSLFILLFSLLVFQSGCTEEPEPNTPPVVEDPVTEDPVSEDPVTDPDDDIDVNALFSLIQGKWIFGERDRSNIRTNSNHRGSLLGFGKTGSSSARLMDDYQGFIEFLSDTTYIFNDPKVLQSQWKLEYGKFQIDVDSKKIILQGFGEIEIQEINNGTVKFDLKESSSNSKFSLEGKKRGFLDDSEKTRLISRIWSLSDENDFGKYAFENLAEGVEVYDEFGEVIDFYYPNEVLFMFSPSGTFISSHLVGDEFKIFDVINWRWSSEERENFETSFDFQNWPNDEEFSEIEGIKVLTENRLIISVLFTYENQEEPELVEWIFNAYKP